MKNVLLLLLLAVASQGVAAAESCQKPLPEAVSGNVTLPAGCVYERSITIVDSNTVLDCNGSIFDGTGSSKIGLYIDSQGHQLSNVTVKNCTFRNFGGGVRISWNAVDSKKEGSKAERYRRSPSKIVLDNLTVVGSERVGVYVDDYVTDVVIKNSVIQDNKGVGIYLEHSSKQNKIIDNRLLRNGFRDHQGAPREALAIDSSAENIIERNHFEGNAAGGIFLYKNCGEHIDNGRGEVRWQHSSYNQIRNNRFVGEEVGIWLASRQSRNLKNWNCADRAMDSAGKFYEDYAENNTVIGNQFSHNKTALRIESDNNEIARNEFECTANATIDLPRTKREEFLRKPQVGNVIEKNKEMGCR